MEKKFNKRYFFGFFLLSIFVGEYGYLKVRIGLFVLLIEGNMSYLDSLFKWENKMIKDIFYYCFFLVMGEMRVDVSVRKSGRVLGEI